MATEHQQGDTIDKIIDQHGLGGIRYSKIGTRTKLEEWARNNKRMIPTTERTLNLSPVGVAGYQRFKVKQITNRYREKFKKENKLIEGLEFKKLKSITSKAVEAEIASKLPSN